MTANAPPAEKDTAGTVSEVLERIRKLTPNLIFTGKQPVSDRDKTGPIAQLWQVGRSARCRGHHNMTAEVVNPTTAPIEVTNCGY